MNINHHPDPSWLVSYAASALPDSFNVVLQAHLAVCSRCKRELAPSGIDALLLGALLP